MAHVKKVLPFFLLVFAVGVRAEPTEKVLWPSAGAELKAQSDSTISADSAGDVPVLKLRTEIQRGKIMVRYMTLGPVLAAFRDKKVSL